MGSLDPLLAVTMSVLLLPPAISGSPMWRPCARPPAGSVCMGPRAGGAGSHLRVAAAAGAAGPASREVLGKGVWV